MTAMKANEKRATESKITLSARHLQSRNLAAQNPPKGRTFRKKTPII
jgi:hypothetical protein